LVLVRWVLGFAFVYLVLTVAPYSKYGPGWATVWVLLTLPFSMVFEIAAPMGFVVYVIIASTVTASFWAALLYAAAAIILRLRRKSL